MSGIKVLFVDDLPDIANGLSDYLNRIDGFHASAKYSGKEALKELGNKIKEGKPYDAIICDLSMPELDGIDVLKEALFLDSYICFIILTAYGSIDTAVRSMNMGAYNYIQKPLDKSGEHYLSIIKRGVAEKKIAKIRHAVLEDLDEKIIIDLIKNAMNILFEFREFILAVIKHDGTDFDVVEKIGDFQVTDLKDRGFIRQLKKNKKRIVELTMDETKRFELNPLIDGSKSLLAEPFVVHNKLFGLIEIESNKENAFSYFDQRTISEFADSAALALNNAKYLQDEIQKYKEQKELLEGINHSIKTPLADIIGRIEKTMSDYGKDLPGAVSNYLNEMMGSARKAERLIRETLIGYRDEEINLEIGEILDYLRDNFKKETCIDWLYNDDFQRSTLRCKPRQIEMAIRNIIENGLYEVSCIGRIKIKGEIHDGVPVGEKEIHIEIRDNGGGIPEEIRKDLFHKPYLTSKANEGGTGLGLYYAYRTIKDNSGDLSYETSKGGTAFFITLPVKTVKEA